MQKIQKVLKNVILAIGGTALVLVAVVLFMQTAARYLFHYSFYWADELSRYSMIWGALLCAAVGISERTHTQLDFLRGKLPPRVRQAIVTLLDLLFFVFAGTMFYYNFRTIRIGMMQRSPGLGIRVGYVYLALSVSMMLMMLFLIPNILDDCKALFKAEEKKQ